MKRLKSHRFRFSSDVRQIRKIIFIELILVETKGFKRGHFKVFMIEINNWFQQWGGKTDRAIFDCFGSYSHLAPQLQASTKEHPWANPNTLGKVPLGISSGVVSVLSFLVTWVERIVISWYLLLAVNWLDLERACGGVWVPFPPLYGIFGVCFESLCRILPPGFSLLEGLEGSGK